jgi:hypothetical protein
LARRLLTIPFSALALGFPGTADGCRVLARAFLRRLFIMPSKLHLAVDALTLRIPTKWAGCTDLKWATAYDAKRAACTDPKRAI